MGAKGSKAEPIIIYNEPDVAIQFTPNLLRVLDGQAPLPPPSLSRPGFPIGGPGAPSAGQSQEDLDEIVRRRVDREVQLHQQKRLVHEQRSADQVRREAEDLLRRQKIAPKTEVNPEYIAKQEAVVKCYRNNPTRTLDCWREVEDLKCAVRKAQREFVAQH